MRRTSWLIAAGFGAAVAAAGGWAAWYGTADPIALLPAPGRVAKTTEDAPPAAPGGLHRRVQYLHLEAGPPGSIPIAVSLPPEGGERLPVVILLAGHRTGRDSVFHVAAPGRNALVGLDYPIPTEIGSGLALVRQAVDLRDHLLSTPAQVVTVLAWIKAQPWADEERVALVGVSLGALFLPAIHNLARRHGIDVPAAVIAYGGAGIGRLVANRLEGGPAWSRRAVGGLAAFALRPLEPALHLPAMRGQFLLIGAPDGDRFLPARSVRDLIRLTPEPKTVVELGDGHYDVEKPELAQRVADTARRWLAERGMTNP